MHHTASMNTWKFVSMRLIATRGKVKCHATTKKPLSLFLVPQSNEVPQTGLAESSYGSIWRPRLLNTNYQASRSGGQLLTGCRHLARAKVTINIAGRKNTLSSLSFCSDLGTIWWIWPPQYTALANAEAVFFQILMQKAQMECTQWGLCSEW